MNKRFKRATALWLLRKESSTVMAILQAGAAINALVDAKRAKSFNNALKMVAANVELTYQRLRTLENRTSMMVKAIMPVDVLKGRIADTSQRLTSQYRMMEMAHHRYNLLFRQTHEMLMKHHFALLLFKIYLTIQVSTLGVCIISIIDMNHL